MSFYQLHRGMPNYPDRLTEFLGDRAPSIVRARGNLDILWRVGTANKASTLALFCSVNCPGPLILQTYDLVCALRDTGMTVVGGFHSPMEKECLNQLLRGTVPVIICPARSIERMQIPSEWQVPLDQGRLLFLSPFEQKQRRATVRTARTRNELVTAIADEVFIAHAAEGSKTEQFCRNLLKWRKPLWTLDSPDNARLITLGAMIVQRNDFQKRWERPKEAFL